MELLRFAIVVASAGLLMLALLPVRRLLRELPAGVHRRAWHWLAGLALVMISAVLLYALEVDTALAIPHELMMPVALLAGSWFVMLISQVSAGSIEDSHRLLTLERESITDSLTGLHNRRYLDQRLSEEVERAQRHGSALSVMMIDADHFKRINDSYGHAVGDEVLRHLAAQIRHVSRRCDLVVRYGGEEITVVSPDAGVQQIRWQAERLRKHIANNPLQLEDGRQIKLSVSIGVGEYALQDGQSGTALLKRVDKALYAAKEQGRNRVEVAAEVSARERVAYIRDWVAKARAGQAA